MRRFRGIAVVAALGIAAPGAEPCLGALPGPPANDDCDAALVVFEGSTPFSNIGATDDGEKPCGNLGADVWFEFTAIADSTVRIDLCGGNFDTVLAVYDNCACVPSNTDCSQPFICGEPIFDCADADPDCFCFTGVAGSGECALNAPCDAMVECEDNGPCPPGFACVIRTCCAVDVCLPVCGTQPVGLAPVFGELTARGIAGIDFDLEEAGQDPVVIACNDDCDDPAADCDNSVLSCVTFEVTSGQCYKIQVGGFSGAQGSGMLNITTIIGGACCLFDGSCTDVGDFDECVALSGVYQGDGGTCAETECESLECLGDFDGDEFIGVTDLLQILASWGPCRGCVTDLDDDDQVGVTDLLELLGRWGECPGFCGDPLAGSCFVTNETPFCDDTLCCTQVCAIDPFCCEDFWGQACVDLALSICGAGKNECPSPGACGSYEICGTGDPLGCFCFEVSFGADLGLCIRDFFCADVAPCGPALDCPSGFVCVTNSCCGAPVCVPVVLCDDPVPTAGQLGGLTGSGRLERGGD